MEDSKHGARVYLMDGNTALVTQAVKSGPEQNADYIVHQNTKGSGQQFVELDDDSAMASAVRAALHGEL